MADTLRVLFAGTPEIALPSLNALAKSPHQLVGVLTAPERHAGRGRRVAVNPIRERAGELGVTVLQPERLGREAREMVVELAPDLLVCVAYGRIFGPRFLALFRNGGINLHPSLLPRFRGPAPIPAAILAGDTETGVTVQALALEMDAGDILAQESVSLSGTETTGALTPFLGERGAGILADVVDQIAAGTASPTPQDPERVTYTGLLRKSDGEIDWRRPASEIERAVRAYHPWPLAFTLWNGQRLNILESELVLENGETPSTARPGTVLRVDNGRGILIETGNGRLALTKLQLQSRKALSWDSFLNGVSDFVGAVLGG